MKGILFVHGFVSWNKDWDFIIEGFDKNEFIIEAPNLKGHEKLTWHNTTNEDWIADVYRAYDRLDKQCDEIYLVGHSMGCILLSHLLHRVKNDPKIKRVAFFNPAFKHTKILTSFFQIPMITYEYLFVILREHNLKRSFKRLFTPPRIIRELYKISSKSQHLIGEIDKEIAIFTGKRDGLVVRKNVIYVYNNISHTNKRFFLRNYGHIPYAAGPHTKEIIRQDLLYFINNGL